MVQNQETKPKDVSGVPKEVLKYDWMSTGPAVWSILWQSAKVADFSHFCTIWKTKTLACHEICHTSRQVKSITMTEVQLTFDPNKDK